jgi:FMN-dependent NADH-azoreductase
MNTLLQLNSSIFSAAGQSTRLADEYVALWRARHPKGQVIVRDFARDPVPHLSAEEFQSFIAAPAQRSAAQRAAVAYSDALIDEIKRADVIVLALPMYNFGIPSMLKAYFDHIARAGVTFRYAEKGPEGLLAGRKVVAFATRGGRYAGTPSDTQTPYVRDFLRLLGITDVQFVYAESLNMGEVSKQAALQRARSEIQDLHAPELAAA